MHTISNKQLRQAIKYIELYRQKVDVKTCGLTEYNDRRMAGILLRKLKEKEAARPQTNTATRETAHGSERRKDSSLIRCPKGGSLFQDENKDKKQDI